MSKPTEKSNNTRVSKVNSRQINSESSEIALQRKRNNWRNKKAQEQRVTGVMFGQKPVSRMETEVNPGFQSKFIKALRRDPEHLPYVWKALNGTQWGFSTIRYNERTQFIKFK